MGASSSLSSSAKSAKGKTSRATTKPGAVILYSSAFARLAAGMGQQVKFLEPPHPVGHAVYGHAEFRGGFTNTLLLAYEGLEKTALLNFEDGLGRLERIDLLPATEICLFHLQ